MDQPRIMPSFQRCVAYNFSKYMQLQPKDKDWSDIDLQPILRTMDGYSCHRFASTYRGRWSAAFVYFTDESYAERAVEEIRNMPGVSDKLIAHIVMKQLETYFSLEVLKRTHLRLPNCETTLTVGEGGKHGWKNPLSSGRLVRNFSKFGTLRKVQTGTYDHAEISYSTFAEALAAYIASNRWEKAHERNRGNFYYWVKIDIKEKEQLLILEHLNLLPDKMQPSIYLLNRDLRNCRNDEINIDEHLQRLSDPRNLPRNLRTYDPEFQTTFFDAFETFFVFPRTLEYYGPSGYSVFRHEEQFSYSFPYQDVFVYHQKDHQGVSEGIVHEQNVPDNQQNFVMVENAVDPYQPEHWENLNCISCSERLNSGVFQESSVQEANESDFRISEEIAIHDGQEKSLVESELVPEKTVREVGSQTEYFTREISGNRWKAFNRRSNQFRGRRDWDRSYNSVTYSRSDRRFDNAKNRR